MDNLDKKFSYKALSERKNRNSQNTDTGKSNPQMKLQHLQKVWIWTHLGS